jgi:hypothetical protein
LVVVAFPKTTFVIEDEATSAVNAPRMAKLVVVAAVAVAFTSTRFVIVEVELFTRSAALMVCCAVHVFAFPRFNEATTAPVVGEMVSVVSPAATEETPVGMQTPSIAKQPSAMVMPFPNVLEAVVPCTSIVRAKTPEPNVVVETPTPNPWETLSCEVEADPVTVSVVEVAPTVTRFVMVEEAASTESAPRTASAVVVAFVPE